VNYSLTFELYGSNSEGRRGDDWRLGRVPVEGFNDIVAPEGGARALSANLGCLPMFNPDSLASYRSVVASWVQNFFILAEHVANHTTGAVATAAPPPPMPPPPAPPAAAVAAADASLPRKLALPKGVTALRAVAPAGGGALSDSLQLPSSWLVPLLLLGALIFAALLRWGRGRSSVIMPWLGKRMGLDDARSL
jgi:hypothetical protein